MIDRAQEGRNLGCRPGEVDSARIAVVRQFGLANYPVRCLGSTPGRVAGVPE